MPRLPINVFTKKLSWRTARPRGGHLSIAARTSI
jgi:hypothetical protein